jgi:dextranase
MLMRRAKLRAWLAIALCIAMLAVSQNWSLAVTVKPSYTSAILMVDGERMGTTVPLRTINGTTMIALKSFATPLGGSISTTSSGSTKSVWFRLGTDKIRFTVGSAKITVYQNSLNLGEMWLSRVPSITSGLFFVPLRETAALVGFESKLEKRTYGSGKVETIIQLQRPEEPAFEDVTDSTDHSSSGDVPVAKATPISTAKAASTRLSGKLQPLDFVINDRGLQLSLFTPNDQVESLLRSMRTRESGTMIESGLVYPGIVYAFPNESPIIKIYQYIHPDTGASQLLSMTCNACKTARDLTIGQDTVANMQKAYGSPAEKSKSGTNTLYSYVYQDHKLIFSVRDDSEMVVQLEVRSSLKGLLRAPTSTTKSGGALIYITPLPATPMPIVTPSNPINGQTPFVTPDPVKVTPVPIWTPTVTPSPTPTMTPTATPSPTPRVTIEPTPFQPQLAADELGSRPGSMIKDVWTNQAVYKPGKAVRIEVSLHNRLSTDQTGFLYVIIRDLDRIVGTFRAPKSLTVVAGQTAYQMLEYQPPTTDYRGYLAEVYFYQDGSGVLDHRAGAFDVASDWTKFPRYGYITDFPDLNADQTMQVISRLNRFKINAIQFYDWQWKHHIPLKMQNGEPALVWKDIANRDVYLKTIRQYVSQAHERNMLAFNYNLMFGSYVNSQMDGVSRDWGLFKDRNRQTQDAHPLPDSWASNRILLQNPSNPGWQEYILRTEQDALKWIAFDGWHIDQLGNRGALYDENGNYVALDQTFAPMIRLAKNRMNTRLVMNAVSEYGAEAIANSPVDVLYTEVWPEQNNKSYQQLRQVVENGLRWGGGQKGQVVAAYMNYNAAERPGYFNKPAVLLTDAVIMASGGSHLELGDTGMLGKEYFPNKNLKISEPLDEALKKYYDFSVAYQTWLRDGVRPIALQASADRVRLNTGTDPRPGDVWAFAREAKDATVVHLINLTGNRSTDWRDDDGTGVSEPTTVTNFRLTVQLNRTAESAWLASPDGSLKLSKLDLRLRPNGSGYSAEIVVPSLQYWDMIVFK